MTLLKKEEQETKVWHLLMPSRKNKVEWRYEIPKSSLKILL